MPAVFQGQDEQSLPAPSVSGRSPVRRQCSARDVPWLGVQLLSGSAFSVLPRAAFCFECSLQVRAQCLIVRHLPFLVFGTSDKDLVSHHRLDLLCLTARRKAAFALETAAVRTHWQNMYPQFSLCRTNTEMASPTLAVVRTTVGSLILDVGGFLSECY